MLDSCRANAFSDLKKKKKKKPLPITSFIPTIFPFSHSICSFLCLRTIFLPAWQGVVLSWECISLACSTMWPSASFKRLGEVDRGECLLSLQSCFACWCRNRRLYSCSIRDSPHRHQTFCCFWQAPVPFKYSTGVFGLSVYSVKWPVHVNKPSFCVSVSLSGGGDVAGMRM